MKTLLLGYGNVDRQDDGVAWHILAQVAAAYGQPVAPSAEDFPRLPGGPDLLFTLQLTPELSETVAAYERVCFIDAHTGNIECDINLADVIEAFQTSPFTHHLTAATCLVLAGALYGHTPYASLLSVRGYEFGFSTHLSSATAVLVPQAVNRLLAWLAIPEIQAEFA